MAETPLHFKTIIEMASLIKSRALSPVEVTESMLNRIQEQDHYYKSYATVMTIWALSTAYPSPSRTYVLPKVWPRWAPPKL